MLVAQVYVQGIYGNFVVMFQAEEDLQYLCWHGYHSYLLFPTTFSYISHEAQPGQNVRWPRPSACLCVYCMDQDVTWGNGRGCPLVVHYWVDLQLMHGFCCYNNIAPNAKCQWVLVVALCLVLVCIILSCSRYISVISSYFKQYSQYWLSLYCKV